MQTQVNDEKREVIPMYKLIDGVAESSFGTRECRCPVLPSAESEGDAEHRVLFVLDVAHLAGVPDSIVTRAESISKEFFADLQEKLARRRRSKLSSIAQAGAFTMLTLTLTLPRVFTC